MVTSYLQKEDSDTKLQSNIRTPHHSIDIYIATRKSSDYFNVSTRMSP